MRIAGIIAEYNPLHSGHAWHIRETRRRTGCDYLVCCMSGHVTQRGGFTCLDKWVRTRMALMSGVDAVFELPALFAVRSADRFALGGTALLDGLGTDILSFGCETKDMETLKRLAMLRSDEPEEVSTAIRASLAQGRSHARAWGEAASGYLKLPPEVLQAPNTILAAEYLRALRLLNSRMQPLAIERRGNYHAPDAVEGTFASAEAIRRLLGEGKRDEAAALVPEALQIFLREADLPADPDILLLHKLRSMSPDDVRAFCDVPEGIENRILREARIQPTAKALIESVKCKRYTHARISRLMAQILIGLDADIAKEHPRPEYARLLGMRREARPLLTEIKRRSRLPVAASGASLPRDSEIFQLECRASDIYALHCGEEAHRRAGRDLTERFIVV